MNIIQVAAKPNYRPGINSPIKDIRLKKFNDSIITIIESIYMMVLLSSTIIQIFL